MKRLNEATGVLEPCKKQTVMDMDVAIDAAQNKLKKAIKKVQEESK